MYISTRYFWLFRGGYLYRKTLGFDFSFFLFKPYLISYIVSLVLSILVKWNVIHRKLKDHPFNWYYIHHSSFIVSDVIELSAFFWSRWYQRLRGRFQWNLTETVIAGLEFEDLRFKPYKGPWRLLIKNFDNIRDEIWYF